MRMEVYVDIIFLLNFVMNSIILFLTAFNLGIDYKLWRIFTTAAVGGIYVLGETIYELQWLYSFPLKMLFSCFLVFFAFGYRRWKSFFLVLATFYMTSFLLGGAVLGWLFLIYPAAPPSHFTLMVSWRHIFAGAFLVIILSLYLRKAFLIRRISGKTQYQIRIELSGKTTECSALLDTGNRLYTVLAGQPVILVELSVLEMIFSDKVIAFLHTHNEEEWITHVDSCIDEQWLSRIVVIPYQSVGKRSMLLGFKVDCLKIIGEGQNIVCPNVVVAVIKKRLSSDGAYKALLHPAVMNDVDNGVNSETNKMGRRVYAHELAVSKVGG